MIFDANLNPFVMEVNMSPNLTPTQDDHEEYSLIYEQVVYNSLQVVGAGSFYDVMSR